MLPTHAPLTASRTLQSATIRVCAVLFAVLALGFGGSLPAASEPSGVVTGRVFNAATNTALNNARVTIEGTAHQTLTENDGSFRFNGVPAGEVRISVSHVGMRTATASVTLEAGGRAEQDFDLVLGTASRATDGTGEKTLVLDTFTVVADREMSAQAVAMNEQRNAPNIKNVVALDEFGDRGTENIGEFLLFLPGVSIETSGSEASSVGLRGFPGNNTGVTVDGGDVAVSFNGSNTRSLDLREIPMSNISRVEVTKVATPDMPASGLGGSINLISRSGFESRKPKLSFNTYMMFHNRNGLTFDGGPRNHVKETSPDWIQPSFDFSYLHPINKNLAITIGGGRSWRAKPMEYGNTTDETADWDIVKMYQRQSQWNSLAQVFRTLSGQIGVDWRISPRDTLSVGFQYRFYGLYITRSTLGFNYGAGATGDRTHTQGAANGVGTVTMNGSGTNVDNITGTRLYTLKYKHRGDTWRGDFAGSFSGSESDKPDIDEGLFNNTPATISNLTIRGEGIPGSDGILPTTYTAVDRLGQVVDLYDGGNYSIDSGSTNQGAYNSHALTARADLARDFDGPLPFTLKIGAALNRIDKDQRVYFERWNFRPNGASDATSRLARNFDVFDEAFNTDSPDVYGRKVRWISNPKLFQLFKQHPDWFVSDPATVHQDFVNNSREFTETVSAAYVRADLRLMRNRLWLVGGVRFERTDVEGAGPLNDILAQYQRNADGSIKDGDTTKAGLQPVLVTTDPLALRKLRYVERGARSDSRYNGWYPSLNATFNITDNLVLRGAYARSLGRPNVNFIIPGVTISEPTAAEPTITVNNPGLKAWTADSFDLSLESYQIKDGFGSIGVFQKNIKNFFEVVSSPATPELLEQYGLGSDPSLLDYDISTRTNGGDAKITGIEFSYRQSLTFLPHWARGMQVFVNATRLELSGSKTADFTGFNPEVFAGGISLVRERFFIKGTLSYLGDTRRSLVAVSAANGIPADTYNYQGKRMRIGVNAQYSLSKRYALYASVNDLGGFVQNLERYAPNTPEYARGNRRQELGFYYTFGVRGTF
jgi:iron complex outermembrane recepter protein